MQVLLLAEALLPDRFGKHIADAGDAIHKNDRIALAVCKAVEVAPPFLHGRFLVVPGAGTSGINAGRMSHNDAAAVPLLFLINLEVFCR